ncbi:methyltransferase domain-containing protein [Arcobacter arenosus]|uniref:Class I SAM-dependent methyltransferase n=1 Tax=Arcobacter arenosus TaxID=2576037 RepID=A0A5R8Y1Z9_9BACT|nr:methyltransferase domain-containing protein [Arcobacter arenosus]TLP39284.1 class I SAM-dependent methyltransferase [Arcobacter arenosus]
MSNLNHKFYKTSYEKFGVTARGVHWNSMKNQYIRFEVLTKFFQKDLENSSILDLGCGFADYLYFLQNKELIPKEYLGIDCEDFMINESKKRFPNHKFKILNFLQEEIPHKDYIICSGALNILKEKEFFYSIEKCFNSSTKGFAFNFLKKDSFNKIKEESIINFCNSLSNKVTISNPYLPNDTSIFIEK